MSVYGLIGLLVAFAGIVVSVGCFAVGHLVSKRRDSLAETLSWGGHIAVVLSTVALTFCCALLVYCFMTGDTSIRYVVQYRSDATGDFAWLYKLSGLWGGREGSLLFWAWLITVFNAVIAVRNMKALERLDNAALFVLQLVTAAFVGVLLFSEANMPFTAMAAQYFDAAGNLTGGAQLWGMNLQLEHWAMAIHPPTLFIGYAGMTVPFAYAIAALLVKDPSKAWVEKCSRFTIFSWLFLGLGIGLGAVWAYVVLGWGGYWGWDPVENASLLPWLVGVALIHSFTVYRHRGAFKRWSVMCACLAFAFVVLGTFITRSGIIQESVHAFEGDPVSLVLFLALIIAAVLAGFVGVLIRWKVFSADTEGGDDFDSFASKDAAYYANNLIMLVAAIVLTYMTLASALPEWLPFGGEKMLTGKYNALARPIGILYLLIMAVCPLLSWGRTQGKRFWKRALVPGICGLVLFALFMVYFATYLLPGYDALIAAGSMNAEGLQNVDALLESGASWQYNGWAVLGFLVASLLFFNSLFLLGRGIRGYAKAKGTNVFVSAFGVLKGHAASYGGFISHLAMAIILAGLIGSSMYVTEKVAYIKPSSDGSSEFVIRDYTLVCKSAEIEENKKAASTDYAVRFAVYKNGELVGEVAPSMEVVSMNERKLVASVMSFPTEDLFIVFRGVSEAGDYSMDVRVNPLISLVWIGFGLLSFGVVVSTVGGRKRTGAKAAVSAQGKKLSQEAQAVAEEAQVEPDIDAILALADSDKTTAVKVAPPGTEEAGDAHAEPPTSPKKGAGADAKPRAGSKKDTDAGQEPLASQEAATGTGKEPLASQEATAESEQEAEGLRNKAAAASDDKQD
ncbi:MAG: cytochrome c biogenesis protein CcsA [Coriobacteriaceae bacterium]|jgi:cytochrome c-type biogenesis protein CcmF|nr:cytochrome c biogenesis protein CcsA [Coriobacteriaceae bacterium]